MNDERSAFRQVSHHETSEVERLGHFDFEMVGFFCHTSVFPLFSENSRRSIADGVGRGRLENALEPLIESSFESIVSPLIPCLQPLIIEEM
jgi:hypothetical protein